MTLDLSKDMQFIYGENSVGKSYAMTVLYALLKSFITYFDSVFGYGLLSEKEVKRLEKKINKLVLSNKNVSHAIDEILNTELTRLLEERVVEDFKNYLLTKYSSLGSISNQYAKKKFKIRLESTAINFSLNYTNGGLKLGELDLTLKEYGKQKELERKEALLQSLSAQMNPHFLYNALNSINNFIVNSEVRNANEYLGDFASLMRKILENSKHEKIPLANEVECINLYVKLEQLRMGHTFRFSRKISPEINAAEVFIPPMLIQPFVENAIWHGLRHKKENGKLELILSKEDSEIICRIKDNGIGLTKSKNMQANKKRRSTGITNVKKRLGILNSIEHSNLKVDVQEITGAGAQTGTEVTIRIACLEHG